MKEVLMIPHLRFYSSVVMVVMLFVLTGCGAAGGVATGDPSLIYTQAAETVAAQLTIAAANQPTNTPPPPEPTTTDTPEPSPTGLFNTATQGGTMMSTIPGALPGTPGSTTPGAGSPTRQGTALGTPINPLASTATKAVQKLGDSATYAYQIPTDGQTFAPETSFMVSFGFINSGTNTWDSGYRLNYFDGPQLGGVSSVPLEVTVPPGAKGEFNIWATVPAAPGDYISRWKMISPSGAFMAEVYLQFKVG
jgi:hypothetical protein